MFSHSMIDGVNLFPMMTAISTEKDFSKLLRVASPSCLRKLLHIVLFPITFLEIVIDSFTVNENANTCLRQGRTTGEMRVVFSDTYSLTKFK